MDQVQITSTNFYPYQLPLHQPWRSAHGVISKRAGWLVRLNTTADLIGWGDCAPLPQIGTETLAVAKARLQEILPQLCGHTPATALIHLDQPAICPPAARCGIETALLDLAAQAAGLPLAQWLRPGAMYQIPVNAALGSIDEDLETRSQKALLAGYQVLKLKLGLQPWELEIQRLRKFAAKLPPKVKLRLDINQAWSLPQAQAALLALVDLPIDAVEEPLANADLSDLAALQRLVPFALALDESLTGTFLDTVIHSGAVRRLVLKPTVQGGLLKTMELANQAQQLGLEVVITSALESSVGIRAVAHVAATIDNSLAHGLATSSWFAQDVMAAPLLRHGKLRLEQQPGLGAAVTMLNTNILSI